MALPTTPPLYILPQAKARAIIPKTAILLSLGIIFYLGILLNLSLLDLQPNQETIAKLISVLIIISLVGVEIIAAIRKAKYDYYFYQDQIAWKNKSITYRTIANIQRREKFSDKIFKTYSLILSDQFQIKHIPQQVNLQEYVEKMITYASGQTGMMKERV